MGKVNHAPETEKIGGVQGWNRSKGRIHVRLTAGQFVTFPAQKSADDLRREAEWLRLKADIFEAFATDMEGGYV